MSQVIVRSVFAVLLAAAVIAVYAPVGEHAFLDHEDGWTVVQNAHLRDPLDLDWIAHTFREVHPMRWTPAAWLSHRLDAAVSGIDAGAMLRTNVGLHTLATLLLFGALGRATERWVAAFFVALLFALHPQRVEAVAWVSARADVLGAFFAMLTVFLYVALPRRGWAEVLVVVALAFGLLSHPSLVAVPFVLLLLDRWPLGRMGSGTDRRPWTVLVVEKLPLFGLVAAYLLIAAEAQMVIETGAPALPWTDRFAHASVATFRTLVDALWPVALSPFHPIGDTDPRFAVVLSATALSAVTLGVFVARRRAPWSFLGWLWFLLFLLPAKGLFGGEIHARADRWAMLPSIGLAIALVFTVAHWTRGRRASRVTSVVVGVVVAAVLGVQARAQVERWSDTGSLFTHALEVDADNWFAHHRLAVVARGRVDFAAAEFHYLEALQRMPGHAQVQGELADVLHAQGRAEHADALHANAERTGFDDPFADRRLGMVLVRIGEDERALPLLEAAVERDPDAGDLHAALALAHARRLDVESARRHLDVALRHAPRTTDGLVLLAWLLATAPEDGLRDARLARRVLEEIGADEYLARADALEAEAAALAQRGDFAAAVATARRAADRADALGHHARAEAARDRAVRYLQGQVWYESRPRRTLGPE